MTIGLLALLSGVAAFSAVQVQKDDPFEVRVDVNLVLFDVSVTNNKGLPVAGLQSGDFRVREDGRPQSISVFLPGDGAATIGLIIDNSGSMAPKRESVINAALAFLSASNARDEMFVVHFNEAVRFALPDSLRFSSDPDKLRPALLQMTPIGQTALYDALDEGIDYLNRGSTDRRILIVVSDGGDNASRRSLTRVLENAQRAGVSIHAIGIYDVDQRDRNPGVLRRLAEQTGGRAFFPGTPSDLERAAREIAGAIRSQYTIGFFSENRNRDGRFRKVDISVASGNDRSGLRVKSRKGYLAPRPATDSR